MAAVELATGYVSLAIETSAVSKSIGGMFKGADTAAGKAGASMGRALKRNFEKANSVDLDGLRKSVEVAEGKITASVERNSAAQAKAKRAVEIAEAELEEKRKSGRASASQLMKAEDKLTLARQKSEAASVTAKADLEKYNKELADSKSALQDAQRAAESSAKGTVSAFAGVGGRIKSALGGDFKSAFTGVKGDAGKAADGVVQEFDAAGDQAGAGVSEGILGSLKGIGGAVAGLGIGLSIAEGITSGMEREKLGDKVAAQLGLTGAESERAGSVAGALYADAYGESMGDVSDAVATVMSSIDGMRGASAEDLQDVTAKALDLSTAFDVDMNEAVGAVGVMMRNGLAPDADSAFDLMVGSLQKVPAGFRDELFPAITEYGKHFSGLGIDGETAMGLLVRGAENGVIGIDKMGDAIKEFQIRATDMSDASFDAYDAIGLSQSEMTAKLLAGGETAETAFADIIHGLQEMEDPAAQSAAAIALFGTPIEDLGVDQIPNFLGAIDPAGDAFDTFTGKAKEMGDALNDNASTRLTAFTRGLQTAFVDVLGGKVIPVVESFWEKVRPVFDWLGDTAHIWGPFAAGIGLVAAAFGVWSAATWLQTTAMTFLAGATWAAMAPILLWVAGIGLVVGALIYAYNNIGWFKDAVDAAWTWIKDVTAAFVAWFVSTAWPAISAALAWLGEKFAWLYENVIKPVFGFIVSVIAGFISWLTGTAIPWVQGAVAAVGAAFTWLNEKVIQPVWNWIKGAVSNVVTWFQTVVVPAFQTAVRVIGDVFNWFQRNIIGPVMFFSRLLINALVSWFQNTAVPLFRAAVQFLADKFTWFRDRVISPVFNWVKSIINSVASWFHGVLVPFFQRAIQSLADKFNWFKNHVIDPVWNFVRSIINSVVSWFRDHIVPVFRRAIQSVSDKFSEFRRWVSDIWGRVRTILGDGWNWINDNVFSKFRDGLDRLKDAFTRTKDGIGDAWDKLKAKVKEPISFVVNSVINPFLNGYNKLNDAWSGDNIPTIPGFRKGGYTGNHGKDDVAGVVHGQEHVIRAESRRSIENTNPGLLDAMNKYGAAAFGKYDNPANMAVGSPVFGTASFNNPINHAIARTGVFQVGGSAPGWGLDQAIRMWDAATPIKVRRGNGRAANGVDVFARSFPAAWAGYYMNDDRSVMLNDRTMGAASPIARRTVAIHELGHALGLPHAHPGHGGNGAWSIMSYDNMYQHNSVTPADVAALSTLYGGAGKAGNASSPMPGGGEDRDGEWSGILGKLRDIVKNPLGEITSKFKDNVFADMGAGIAKQVVDGLIEKGKSLFFGGDSTSAKVNGVWDDPVGTVQKLRPGLSTIYNGTGSSEFFQRVDPNGGSNVVELSAEDRARLDRIAERVDIKVDGRSLVTANRTAEAKFARR